jgi:hypothetical protein
MGHLSCPIPHDGLVIIHILEGEMMQYQPTINDHQHQTKTETQESEASWTRYRNTKTSERPHFPQEDPDTGQLGPHGVQHTRSCNETQAPHYPQFPTFAPA